MAPWMKHLCIIFCCFLSLTAANKSGICTQKRSQHKIICSGLVSIDFNITGTHLQWILIIRDSTISTISSDILPSQISDFANLQMQNLGLEEISPGTFGKLERLTRLNLSDNSVSVLGPRLFNKNLQQLDLSRNKISHIDPEAFSGMGDLTEIYLEYNDLEALGQSLFKDCSKLQSLYLSNNKIETVDPKAFQEVPRLVELDLSHNEISNLHPETFSKLNKLYELYLEYNNLGNLSHGLFSNCSNLKKLYLSHSNIHYVDSKVFQGAEKVGHLDLSNNQISDLYPGTFTELYDLLYLDVSYNELTILRNDLFPSLSYLSYFKADHNKIKFVDKYALKTFQRLRVLDLSYNEISNVQNGSFCIYIFHTANFVHNHLTEQDVDFLTHCSQIRDLLISSNQIKHLQLDSNQVFSVRSLNLSDNEIIGELNLDNFFRKGILRSLYLDHNKINIIKANTVPKQNEGIPIMTPIYINVAHNEISKASDGAFSKSLSYYKVHEVQVDASYNQITSFSKWFIGSSDVKSFNLSHNIIQKIDKHSLKGALKLYELDLSYNQISEISDNSFSSSPLKMLLLDHNNLTILRKNVFRNCSQLSELDISFNKIRVIELKVFKHINYLRKLDLSHNQIEVLDPSSIRKHLSVRMMYLQNNLLSDAQDFTFINCDSLLFLDVSYNKLTEIPSVCQNLMLSVYFARGEKFTEFKLCHEAFFNSKCSTSVESIDDIINA